MNSQLSRQSGSNRWPAAYKAAALPTELCRHNGFSVRAHHYSSGIIFVKYFFYFYDKSFFAPNSRRKKTLYYRDHRAGNEYDKKGKEYGFNSTDTLRATGWKRSRCRRAREMQHSTFINHIIFFPENQLNPSDYGKILAVIEMMRGIAALW